LTEAPDGRDLMLAVSADVPGSFQTLVEVYETRVKAAVSRSIRDSSSVDDLAQEVFLRLYRARARYQPTARFETFLYRIIFNLCVNHTQHMNRRRTWSLDAPISDDEERTSFEPEDARGSRPLEALEETERADIVRKCVDVLPDSQRQAIMLSRFEGLGYQEIANVMGLSLPAVKSLLWRARENMRQRLQPVLGELDVGDQGAAEAGGSAG
jgi:RNA polymerase sigma-70 factor (ECF subfamily)